MNFGIVYCVHLKSFHFILFNSINPLLKGNLNKPTGALINLMSQLNNFSDQEKENNLKLKNCKYREIDYFQKISKNFKRTLSFFHMNVCLLDDFNILLNNLSVI